MKPYNKSMMTLKKLLIKTNLLASVNNKMKKIKLYQLTQVKQYNHKIQIINKCLLDSNFINKVSAFLCLIKLAKAFRIFSKLLEKIQKKLFIFNR